MKQRLAERLLAKVMNWNDDQVKAELQPLLLLAEFKYDEYHQFGPGMRFIERLARWLSQLKGDTEEDTIHLRNTAFTIVRDHLIFISSDEMYSLIGMAYPEKILPLQRSLSAIKSGCDEHRICRIERSQEFRSLVSKTLYVGLSDGSQTGMLRRMNPNAIDHEFTLLSYDQTADKAQSILSKLPTALAKSGIIENNPKFELIVLVDDFTASGTSFIRKEDGMYAGKLQKVIMSMSGDGSLSSLVNLSTTTIQVLFYISTEYALQRIKQDISAFLATQNCGVNIVVDAVHVIPTEFMKVCANNSYIDDLLQNRFEKFKVAVLDPNYKKGDCTYAHRGFNGGDLALILFHNSPNNALPVLWYEGPENIALFPRTTRHGRK